MKALPAISANSPDGIAARSYLRCDWTREEVRAIYHQPLLELVFNAQQAHRQYHDPAQVQLCQLLSIKTGGCPEDCAYCPQSAHYPTGVEHQGLLAVDEVYRAAQQARQEGASRFCMGAAWREVRDGKEFDTVLEMVQTVASLGLEVCCTLGMLSDDQARRLADAGLTAYNHNLDTSPEFYSARSSPRGSMTTACAPLRRCARRASPCVAAESSAWANRTRTASACCTNSPACEPHPESVPINMLVRVEGTPLGGIEPADPLTLARTIATARLLMPVSMVRLSAGRRSLTREAAALCFLAGANSIFVGEKLLTTPNPERDADDQLFRDLGLRALEGAAERAIENGQNPS